MLSWTPHLLQILLRSHGSLPRVVGAELGLVVEVMVAASGPDLLRPHSGEDAHVGSIIQFPSSTECSRPFDVRDPYGPRSIRYCLFWLGLTSSRMATSENFRVVLRVGPVTLRLSGG